MGEIPATDQDTTDYELFPVEQTDNSVWPEDGPQLEDDGTPLSQEPCLDDEASGDVVRLLNQARGQLGYREGSSNDTKYGVAFGMNHVAWCQEFDWWVAFSISFPHLKTASTMAAVADARKNGTFHNGYAGIAPGDSAYFHWPNSTRAANQPDHVGIIEFVRVDGAMQTIEGNSGNMVKRNLRRANILGYIRHAFPSAPVVVTPPVTPPASPKPPVRPMPLLRFGSVGGAVRTLQTALNAHGQKLVVDGHFGPRTLAAVRAWQKRSKLVVDGIVGPKTWKSLGW